jgi:hypothetical protein
MPAARLSLSVHTIDSVTFPRMELLARSSNSCRAVGFLLSGCGQTVLLSPDAPEYFTIAFLVALWSRRLFACGKSGG